MTTLTVKDINRDLTCTNYGEDKFFITEDQLPEYLAAQLLGEAE